MFAASRNSTEPFGFSWNAYELGKVRAALKLVPGAAIGALQPEQAAQRHPGEPEEQTMSMLDMVMAGGCLLLVALIILRKKAR